MRIIGEIANAHGGSQENALELANFALKADVDIVKFQIYFADELLVPSHSRFQHFSTQQFDQHQWDEIFAELKSSSRKLAADVFGVKALQTAVKNNVGIIKVHSSDLVNFRLLRQVNEAGVGEVILSTGGATGLEIYQALVLLKNIKTITLMHGFQAYPTAVHTMDMQRIQWLKKVFGHRCFIGFQDHVSGDDPLAFSIPAAAIGAGSEMVEKHLTKDRSKKGVDYYSSLEPGELKSFVAQMRMIWSAFNTDSLQMSEPERAYRKSVIKHPVLSAKSRHGDVLMAEKIEYRRVEKVESKSIDISLLDKRRLKYDIEPNIAVTGVDLDRHVVACIIVRNKSTRLPDKAFTRIGGYIPLEHLIARVRRSKLVNEVIVCTSDQEFDDRVELVAQQMNVQVVRGDEFDVLGRIQRAIEISGADTVLRVTGDDILFCSEQVDEAINLHISCNADYTDMKSMPSGTEAEIFSAQVLTFLHKNIKSSDSTEYLTNYIKNNEIFFETCSYDFQGGAMRDIRLTLDTIEDQERLERMFSRFKNLNIGIDYSIKDIYDAYHTIDMNVPKEKVKVKSPDIDYNIYINFDLNHEKK
jgi:N,N'-diacetyllegionaminate synthase